MEINAVERELLAEETDALIAQVREPQRARYVELREALNGSAVPEDSVGALENLLALELRTGRARKIHGPMAETALLRLFGRTPTGAGLQKSTATVNNALAALEGHPGIEAIDHRTPSLEEIFVAYLKQGSSERATENVDQTIEQL